MINSFKNLSDGVQLSIIWGLLLVVLIITIATGTTIHNTYLLKTEAEIIKCAMENGYIEQEVPNSNRSIWVKK